MNDNQDCINFKQIDNDYELSGITSKGDYNEKTTIKIFENDGYSSIIS